MIRILKYDFYKLKNSKSLRIFYIVAAIFLFSLIASWFVTGSFPSTGVYVFMHNAFNVAYYLAVIFFCGVFIGEDFSFGYVKNIYPSVNKLYYILSKVVYILAFCLLLWLFCFAFSSLFIFIFGERTLVRSIEYLSRGDNLIFKTDAEYKAAFYKETFCFFGIKVIGMSAVGMITMFLTLLFKKGIIVACIELLYTFFLCNPLSNKIGELLDCGNVAKYYMPFASNDIVMAIRMEHVPGAFITFGCLTVMFAILSFVLVKFRKV